MSDCPFGLNMGAYRLNSRNERLHIGDILFSQVEQGAVLMKHELRLMLGGFHLKCIQKD